MNRYALKGDHALASVYLPFARHQMALLKKRVQGFARQVFRPHADVTVHLLASPAGAPDQIFIEANPVKTLTGLWMYPCTDQFPRGLGAPFRDANKVPYNQGFGSDLLASTEPFVFLKTLKQVKHEGVSKKFKAGNMDFIHGASKTCYTWNSPSYNRYFLSGPHNLDTRPYVAHIMTTYLAPGLITAIRLGLTEYLGRVQATLPPGGFSREGQRGDLNIRLLDPEELGEVYTNGALFYKAPYPVLGVGRRDGWVVVLGLRRYAIVSTGGALLQTGDIPYPTPVYEHPQDATLHRFNATQGSVWAFNQTGDQAISSRRVAHAATGTPEDPYYRKFRVRIDKDSEGAPVVSCQDEGAAYTQSMFKLYDWKGNTEVSAECRSSGSATVSTTYSTSSGSDDGSVLTYWRKVSSRREGVTTRRFTSSFYSFDRSSTSLNSMQSSPDDRYGDFSGYDREDIIESTVDEESILAIDLRYDAVAYVTMKDHSLVGYPAGPLVVRDSDPDPDFTRLVFLKTDILNQDRTVHVRYGGLNYSREGSQDLDRSSYRDWAFLPPRFLGANFYRDQLPGSSPYFGTDTMWTETTTSEDIPSPVPFISSLPIPEGGQLSYYPVFAVYGAQWAAQLILPKTFFFYDIFPHQDEYGQLGDYVDYYTWSSFDSTPVKIPGNNFSFGGMGVF